jgi:ABC-2 type transport system ATP-binding protein
MKAIEIDHLKKTFGDREVLHDISLDIDQGEIFAFLGPNGSGKTTTMRIAVGVLKPTSGSVTVLGEDLNTSIEARNRIGVLLERHGLYERLTLRENLDHYARLFGIAHRRDAVEQVLHEVHMEQLGDDRVGLLSTGMKRRAGLARALLNGPDVLFLDEPTSSLDPEMQRDFRELILELSRRRRLTVFLNTHNLDEAQRLCGKIAILDAGSIRISGGLDNIRSSASRTEVMLCSEEEAVRFEALLSSSGIGTGTVRSGRTVAFTPLREVTARDVVQMGFDLREFCSRQRTLDEVYFEVMNEAEA